MKKRVMTKTGPKRASGGRQAVRDGAIVRDVRPGRAVGDSACGRSAAGSGRVEAETGACLREIPSAACPCCPGPNVSVTDGGVHCSDCRTMFPRTWTAESRWHRFVSSDRGTWPRTVDVFNVAVLHRAGAGESTPMSLERSRFLTSEGMFDVEFRDPCACVHAWSEVPPGGWGQCPGEVPGGNRAMNPRLISVREAACRCGVSRSTVFNLLRGYYVKDGRTVVYTGHSRRFPSPVRVGRQVRIRESELMRWLESCEEKRPEQGFRRPARTCLAPGEFHQPALRRKGGFKASMNL